MIGIDGLAMLRNGSMEDSVILGAVIRRAREIRQENIDKLANAIRQEIVEAWNKGQK